MDDDDDDDCWLLLVERSSFKRLEGGTTVGERDDDDESSSSSCSSSCSSSEEEGDDDDDDDDDVGIGGGGDDDGLGLVLWDSDEAMRFRLEKNLRATTDGARPARATRTVVWSKCSAIVGPSSGGGDEDDRTFPPISVTLRSVGFR